MDRSSWLRRMSSRETVRGLENRIVKDRERDQTKKAGLGRTRKGGRRKRWAGERERLCRLKERASPQARSRRA